MRISDPEQDAVRLALVDPERNADWQVRRHGRYLLEHPDVNTWRDPYMRHVAACVLFDFLCEQGMSRDGACSRIQGYWKEGPADA
jgi:hypothetical protein